MPTTLTSYPGQAVLKVEFSDPAGAFAGWFLHVVPVATPIGVYDGSPASAFSTYTSGAVGDAWRASIERRLAVMFGEGRAKYFFTYVAQITDEAEVDTTFGDD